MKTYAEEQGMMSQPRKFSNFELHITKQNSDFSPAATVSSTRACYYKIHGHVEYTPKICFNSFLQSAVDARRQGDKNPKYNLVAETMGLLAKNSYGYQILDCSRHTVTKSLSDEKIQAANFSKIFK